MVRDIRHRHNCTTKINPLDAIRWQQAGIIIGGQNGSAIAVANIVHNINALIFINRGRDKNVSDIERTMIKAAVGMLEAEKKPALGHLLHFLLILR